MQYKYFGFISATLFCVVVEVGPPDNSGRILSLSQAVEAII